MQQPQGPLELGLLAPHVVPHLGAHVFPARVEAQHPSPLLLLVEGTGAASEAQTQLPRLAVASPPGVLPSCSPPPRNFRGASAFCSLPSLTPSCSSAPLRADTLSHLAAPSHRLDTTAPPPPRSHPAPSPLPTSPPPSPASSPASSPHSSSHPVPCGLLLPLPTSPHLTLPLSYLEVNSR